MVCAEVGTIEDELLAIFRDRGLARRLMIFSGVPIVTLNLIAAIEAVGRVMEASADVYTKEPRHPLLS